MKKAKESYRLPSGKYTTNVEYFVRVWKYGMPIMEKVYGLKLRGFNPDYTFTTIDAPNGRDSNPCLSYDLVQKMIQTAKKAKKLDKHFN